MGNPVEKPAPGYLWVEAELLAACRASGLLRNSMHVNVEPADVRVARASEERFGSSNFIINAKQLTGSSSFPARFIPDLMAGRAVRFQMSYDMFNRAVQVTTRFRGGHASHHRSSDREIASRNVVGRVVVGDDFDNLNGLEALWAEEDESPTYRWIITKDYISGGEEKGIQGPRGADLNLKTNRAHFVMKDDDGEVYYEGDIYGDYDGFEPLEDFGRPNAGASSIWYKGKML
jgi:hypothetical protein